MFVIDYFGINKKMFQQFQLQPQVCKFEIPIDKRNAGPNNSMHEVCVSPISCFDSKRKYCFFNIEKKTSLFDCVHADIHNTVQPALTLSNRTTVQIMQ